MSSSTTLRKPPQLKKKQKSQWKHYLNLVFPLLAVVGAIYLSYTSTDTPTIKPNKIDLQWPEGSYEVKKQADRYYLSKNYNEALEKYEQVYNMLDEADSPELGTKKAAVANNLANTYKKLNKVSAALPWYKKGLESDGDHVETLYNYANTLLALTKHDDAEPLFRKALELRPKFEMAMMGLAGILRHRGIFDESKELLLKANKIQPKNADILANLGLQYLGEKDVETSIKYLKEAADMGHDGAKRQLSDLMKALKRVTQNMVDKHNRQTQSK